MRVLRGPVQEEHCPSPRRALSQERDSQTAVCSTLLREAITHIAHHNAWPIYAQTGSGRHLNNYSHTLRLETEQYVHQMTRTEDPMMLSSLANQCGRWMVNLQRAFCTKPAIEFRAFAGTLNEAKIFHHLATALGLMRRAATVQTFGRLCVIIICPPKIRPDLDTLCLCAKANPHGNGIAWREGGEVRWRKTDDVEEIHQLACMKSGEVVIHFRIASVGDVCPELRHPFPVSKRAGLAATGSAKAWLFQMKLRANRHLRWSKGLDGLAGILNRFLKLSIKHLSIIANTFFQSFLSHHV